MRKHIAQSYVHFKTPGPVSSRLRLLHLRTSLSRRAQCHAVWHSVPNVVLAAINEDWYWAVPVALVGVGVALGLLKGVRATRIPWVEKV